MARLGTRTRRETPRASDGFRAPAAVGLIGATLLIVAAMVVPPATGWDVRIGVAPIFAHWDPRVGPGTLGAVVIGLSGISYAHEWSAGVTWPRLLALSWVGSLGWL